MLVHLPAVTKPDGTMHQGRELRVKTSLDAKEMVWMELSPDNSAYLQAAVQASFDPERKRKYIEQ